MWDYGLGDSDEATASHFRGLIKKMVDVLNVGLVYQGDQDSTFVPVDHAVASKLLPYLDRWKGRLGPEHGGDVCEMAAALLRKERRWVCSARIMRKTMKPDLQKCGLETCNVRNDQLRTCGRCHIALYCSREHQEQHWENHGNLCHPTVY